MSTRKLESQATQALEQVTTENEKGTDQQYFQNRWSKVKETSEVLEKKKKKKKSKSNLKFLLIWTKSREIGKAPGNSDYRLMNSALSSAKKKGK